MSDAGSVDNFIAEQENKATLQKTQRGVKLLQTFLGTKNELKTVEEIPALELNENMCEFIISVRIKDDKDYEPSSLRSLLASSERHLKKNSYSASIMNDFAFEETRKVLLSKQKELKKKGKGNKPFGKRFDSFNQWWIEYALRKRPLRYTETWSAFKHTLVKQHHSFWAQRLQRT